MITQLSSPEKISLEHNDPDEVLLMPEALAVKMGSLELLPYNTSTGVEFIDAAYMRPFGDVESDLLEVYERRTPDGDPYFAVKAGLILLGLIFPVEMVSDVFVRDLRRIAEGCGVTLAHKKEKTAEEDAEQMEMEEVS